MRGFVIVLAAVVAVSLLAAPALAGGCGVQVQAFAAPVCVGHCGVQVQAFAAPVVVAPPVVQFRTFAAPAVAVPVGSAGVFRQRTFRGPFGGFFQRTVIR